MKSRRELLKASGCLTAVVLLGTSRTHATKVKNVGIQLYTVRKEMLAGAKGTLQQLAKMGGGASADRQHSYNRMAEANVPSGRFYQ